MTLRTAAIVASFLALSAAQNAAGSLSGTITDKDGGVIPGATVTVIGSTSRQTITTNSQGRFQLDGLAAGQYRIEVRLSGFATRIEPALTIASGQTTTWNASLGFWFGYSEQIPTTPDPTIPGLAKDVYSVVLRDIARNDSSSRVVVVAESLIPLSQSDDLWSGPGGIPAELRTRLDVAENRSPVLLSRSAFPSNAEVVGRAAIRETFRSGSKDGFGGWTTFEKKFGTHRYVSFSRVLLTDDKRQALVYFETYCGTLCGEGTLVWLARDSLTMPWTIRGRRGFWVS